MSVVLSLPSATLSANEHVLVVTGDLEMNAVAQLAAAGNTWLSKTRLAKVAFDFTGVIRANSAALSILCEWLRACHRLHLPIESIQLSVPLGRLAALSELDGLISQPNKAS